jgi:hypothetical protein
MIINGGNKMTDVGGALVGLVGIAVAADIAGKVINKSNMGMKPVKPMKPMKEPKKKKTPYW